MTRALRLALTLRTSWRSKRVTAPRQAQTRPIATHGFNHHASLLSIISSKVDKSSEQYEDNAKQMGEVMARMQELHQKIELGGPAKAREKHIARGKMLPREYVEKECM